VTGNTANGFHPEFQEAFQKAISTSGVPEVNDGLTPDVLDDTYLNMELSLPGAGGEAKIGRVVKHLRDKDEVPIGMANDNPILDSRIYEVVFSDGH
jgi:hypothetical protein